MDIILGYYTQHPSYLSMLSLAFLRYRPVPAMPAEGSRRVPEGAFCVKLWRSVPLVSITYDSFSSVQGSSRPPRKSYRRPYCLFL